MYSRRISLDACRCSGNYGRSLLFLQKITGLSRDYPVRNGTGTLPAETLVAGFAEGDQVPWFISASESPGKYVVDGQLALVIALAALTAVEVPGESGLPCHAPPDLPGKDGIISVPDFPEGHLFEEAEAPG